MTILTKPQGNVALGHAMVQGQRVPVIIDIEWDRYLSILTLRAGGVNGVSTTELVESSFEDAGINEMQAQMFTNENGQNQRPPVSFVSFEPLENTAELHARISALESEIQALKQGAEA